jgi:subtilisin family serine protease
MTSTLRWPGPPVRANNGKDDDRNGYVDDTYGYNAIKGRGSGEDDNGHGTHVAGIVGARGNNGHGETGTCWSTKLVGVKFMNSQGRGATSEAIEGIHYAVKNGLKIINCSFGSSASSSALRDAVDHAQDRNALLVVAAGNNGRNITSTSPRPATASTPSTWTAVTRSSPARRWLRPTRRAWLRFCESRSRERPTASCERRFARNVYRPPAFRDKVVSDGRLNAPKSLAAIASIVD